MKYEHIPRPEVERHYHIKTLIESQEKRVDDRNYHREKQKTKEEREDLIKDAKPYVQTDFWCETCKEDFKAQAIKEIEEDWNGNGRNAFYKTKCFKGHWCIRLITDRHKDAYWFKSRAVLRDQGIYYKDTIQPFQTGYNMLYKKI